MKLRYFAAALAVLLTVPIVSLTPASAATPAREVYVQVKGGSVGSIVASPVPLAPGFSPSIHDYTLRCRPGINTITLTLTAQDGVIRVDDKSGHTVSVEVPLVEGQAAVVKAPDPTQYWIRCLPHDFSQLRVTGTGRPGWYLIGGSTYAMILDEHGTPVWFQAAKYGVVDFKRLYDQTRRWPGRRSRHP